jgi:hypothetical protein
MFYDMEKYIPAVNSAENIYNICGVDKNGKVLAVVTHYTDDDNAAEKTDEVDFGKQGNYEIYLLDETHDGELISTTADLNFTLKNQTCILIKEI